VARLSIVIPAFRDTAALEETLVSVLTHRPADCEIIVPHANTYSDPYELSEEVEFLPLGRRARPAKLIAAAIGESAGRFVHLLQPGCEVAPGWCDAALRHFEDERVASVSPLLVDRQVNPRNAILGVGQGVFGCRKEAVAKGSHLRAVDGDHEDDAGEHQNGAGDHSERVRLRQVSNVLGPTLTAGFYRREALEQIGGWPLRLGISAADIDVALSLQEAGWRAAVEKTCPIACGASRAGMAGAFERARDSERLFWRHRRSAWSKAIHPLAALGGCLFAGHPLQMALAGLGKLAACFDLPAARRHRALLSQCARARPPEPPSAAEAAPKAPEAVCGADDHRRAA